MGIPGHPPAFGVTVIVATASVVPLLFAVNPPIFPEPEVPKPTFMLLVQSNVVPAVGLEKLIAPTEASSQ